jgi:hypothetical protein
VFEGVLFFVKIFGRELNDFYKAYETRESERIRITELKNFFLNRLKSFK